MLKILIIVKTLALGGVGSVIFSYYEAVNALQRTDIHMDFAAGEPIEERYRKAIEAGGSKLFITNKDGNLLSYVNKIATIVRTGKYDVVHVHGNSALIAPDLLGAKIGGARKRIAHSHNTTCDNKKMDRLARPLFNYLYTDAVACGEDAGKWMFGDRPFTVLKNGIQLEQYIFNSTIRKSSRDSLGLGEDFVIGHVGNFNYQKNHAFLIDVFKTFHAQHPNSKLLLVGDGEKRNEIMAQVKNYGIEENVIFYGVSDNVSSLLMAMDCFVLPSRFEGLPCVLVEAQATGLPCVVSDAVSEEAKMSSCYYTVDRNLLNEWCRAIESVPKAINRRDNSKNSQRLLTENGYSMTEASRALVRLYNV